MEQAQGGIEQPGQHALSSGQRVEELSRSELELSLEVAQVGGLRLLVEPPHSELAIDCRR